MSTDDLGAVTSELIAINGEQLIIKMAEVRRGVILLRDRLKAAGELTPASAASLDQADEAYRASIEIARNTRSLQADTVAKLAALLGEGE